MKATIEFDLPENDYEHKCAVNAIEMACFIFETFSYIRNAIKHDQNVTDEQVEILEKLRDDMNERINDHCINFVME